MSVDSDGTLPSHQLNKFTKTWVLNNNDFQQATTTAFSETSSAGNHPRRQRCHTGAICLHLTPDGSQNNTLSVGRSDLRSSQALLDSKIPGYIASGTQETPGQIF